MIELVNGECVLYLRFVETGFRLLSKFHVHVFLDGAVMVHTDVLRLVRQLQIRGYLALIGFESACQHLHECCLAGCIWPHHSDYFAIVDSTLAGA